MEATRHLRENMSSLQLGRLLAVKMHSLYDIGHTMCLYFEQRLLSVQYHEVHEAPIQTAWRPSRDSSFILSLSTLETAKVQGTCRRCLEGL